jgi:hypothetical protein
VKNRAFAILLMLLACVPVLLQRATSNELLKDSDTNFLIYKMNEYNNPLRWFTHDWPLENHFYRPISTLVFEADNRLHPGSGAAFGLTNALTCAICILLTGWFVTEMKRSLTAGVVASWISMVWILNSWFFGRTWIDLVIYVPYLLFALIILRMISDKKFNWVSLATAVGGFFVWYTLLSSHAKLSSDTMNWIPGRTATVMTIFTMLALASYVRFERLGAASAALATSTALDEPATRSSTQSDEPRNRWGWFVLSAVATAFALLSYEQAVMLPFVIFFVGVWLRSQGTQTRFALQTVFWMLLIGYVIVRLQFVPLGASKYQSQQFRHGPGLWIDILNYVFPNLLGLRESWIAITTGFIMVISTSFWAPLFMFASNVAAWITVRKDVMKCVLPLAMATLAFLPMAFLNQFGHYHFWPAMLLTLFVIGLFESYWKMLIIAMSPQAFQAPQRLDRAPGSLPRL